MSSSSTSRAEAAIHGVRLGAVVLVLAAPVLVLLVHGASALSLELIGHLARTVLPMQLGYSLGSAGGAVMLGAILSAGGLLCGIFEFPGRAVLQRLLLLPLLLPVWFLAAVYHDVFGWQGVAGLSLVLGLGAAPLFHLFGLAALRNLPGRYSDVLRSLGAHGPLRIASVLMPLCLPALGAAALVSALLSWADVAGARTMAVPTLTIGLMDQWFGREDTLTGAGLGIGVALLSMLFGLAVVWVFGRQAWHDDARVAGPRLMRWKLRGWRGAMPWVLSAPQWILGAVLPGVLVARWTAERIDRVDLGSLGADTARTLLVAAGATLLAFLLAAPLVHAAALARSRRAAFWLMALPFALFALPPAVLALGALLLAPDRLGATALPLVGALGVRFVAVFAAALDAAMLRHARAHVALLRVLGRTGLSSFAGLLRPFVARPVTAAAAFVFLESLKEVMLPLVLQPFGFNTLSTRVFQYAQTQQLRDCAVWILCLGLIGIYPLFTLARAGEAGSDGPDR